MQTFNEDCFTFMDRYSTGSIDCIITDPPYGINFQNINWDKNIDFLPAFFQKSYELLKPSGTLILFTGWSSLREVLNCDSNFILKNIICYDRIKGRGAKYNFVSTREEILFFSKTDKYTFNVLQSTIKKKTGGLGLKNGKECRTLSNVWSDISPIVPWSAERSGHPTQKPIQLMERIVNVFTNKGDLILDPFMGSGSTLVAAKKLERNYAGCDINKEYFDITNTRLLDLDKKDLNNDLFVNLP